MILQEKKKTENKKDDRLRVCFVCTGNTCRSPMAAAVLNHLAPERFTATSAGLCASGGKDMSRGAQIALESMGVKVPAHISRPFTETTAKDNDIIIAMTGAHLMTLMQAFPEYMSKFEVMPHEISDPFGMDDEAYKKCLDEIVRGIKERFAL